MKTILLTAALGLSALTRADSLGRERGAPRPPRRGPDEVAKAVHDQTLREIVRVTIGGDTVRVRLSNAFGPEPVEIGSAHVALRESGAAIMWRQIRC